MLLGTFFFFLQNLEISAQKNQLGKGKYKFLKNVYQLGEEM